MDTKQVPTVIYRDPFIISIIDLILLDKVVIEEFSLSPVIIQVLDLLTKMCEDER